MSTMDRLIGEGQISDILDTPAKAYRAGRLSAAIFECVDAGMTREDVSRFVDRFLGLARPTDAELAAKYGASIKPFTTEED